MITQVVPCHIETFKYSQFLKVEKSTASASSLIGWLVLLRYLQIDRARII